MDISLNESKYFQNVERFKSAKFQPFTSKANICTFRSRKENSIVRQAFKRRAKSRGSLQKFVADRWQWATMNKRTGLHNCRWRGNCVRRVNSVEFFSVREKKYLPERIFCWKRKTTDLYQQINVFGQLSRIRERIDHGKNRQQQSISLNKSF